MIFLFLFLRSSGFDNNSLGIIDSIILKYLEYSYTKEIELFYILLLNDKNPSQLESSKIWSKTGLVLYYAKYAPPKRPPPILSSLIDHLNIYKWKIKF